MLSNTGKLSLIILLGLFLRVMGVFWGHPDRTAHNIWEPDEYQHSEIAAFQVHTMDNALFNKRDFSNIWNLRAYGTQLGVFSYLGYKLGIAELSEHKIIMLGRFLSCLYGIFLIIIVYQFTTFLFHKEDIALLAALFMAIFDLNITYSHYALPASSYIFWAYFSLYLCFQFYNKIDLSVPLSTKELVLSPQLYLFSIPLALCFATKLDFIPIFIAIVIFAILFLRKKISFPQTIMLIAIMAMTMIIYFFLCHGFNLGLDDLLRSIKVARGENENIIWEDNHWLHNPILFFIGVIGGTSIWVTLFVILSTIHLVNSTTKIFTGNKIYILLLLVFLALEFLVRWRMDAPFIRRANIFLPYCAIIAAYGLKELFDRKISSKVRSLLIGFVVLYTLGITISSQSNFWFDTRYKAEQYIKSNISNQEKIKYSVYAKSYQMPKETGTSFEDTDWLIIHEAFYGRYWKSFTTPFKIPDCCEEVYHCGDKKICESIQNILSDKTSFKLKVIYPTIEIFPERILFKRLFGTYETFLGDVRIYKKESQ